MTYGLDNSPTDFSPIDTGTTPNENQLSVENWLNRITKAKNKEEQWRKRAKRIVRIYRTDSETEGTTYSSNRPYSYNENPYNILWSNIQTLQPALYSQLPKPDVRSRFLAQDPDAKMAGDIIEKVLMYEMDRGNFDGEFRKVLFDYLGPGRGAGRIRLIPQIDKREIKEESPEGEISVDIQEELISQQCKFERIPWDRAIFDPVNCWDDMEWIGFEHQLTQEQWDEYFPEEKGKVAVVTHDINKFEQLPRYEVYEIWDKSTEQVYYMASGSNKLLKVQDDPFLFEHFWPMTEPLVAIRTGDTMVPVPEFTIYENQAYELNQVTYRITDLVKACKFHGIYDSSQNNMEDLLQSADSTFVPDNGDNMKKNGIKNIMDFVDTSPVARVLEVLFKQRDEILEIIYDLTGISDIIRGEGQAAETATASELKSRYAGLRLRDRREAINKFIVQNLRMMTHMICKFYPLHQLEAISGETITPEVEKILRDDVLRNYKVDIETDSTVLANHEEDSSKRAALLAGIAQFIETFYPLVQARIIPLESAKALLMYGLGASKLPRSVTDALDKIGEPEIPQQDPMQAGMMPQEQQGMPEGIPPELLTMMGNEQVSDQVQDYNL